MSLVLNYRLDEANPADIGTEYVSGTNAAVNNNVSTTTDATYGNSAEFNGSSANLFIENIPQLVGHVSRTYSFWVSFDTLVYPYTMLLSMDDSNGTEWAWVYGMTPEEKFYEHVNGVSQLVDPTVRTMNTWYHVVSTYDSTTSSSEHFIDGVSGGSNTETIGATTGNLSVGNLNYSGKNWFDGKMLDLRVYDGVLSTAEIALVYSLGPNAPTAVVDAFTLVTRPLNMLVDITAVPGATEYRLTYEGPTGGEIVAHPSFTDLSQNIISLEPDTEYIIRLYSKTGSVFELVRSIVTMTLENTSANHDVTDFEVDGVFDLDDIDATTKENLSEVMNDLFTTGDKVIVSVSKYSNLKTTFVGLGGSASMNASDSLLLPFDDDGGVGQDMNLTLTDDATNVSVIYDESANTISVNSVAYAPGDVFILDGKKVNVIQY